MLEAIRRAISFLRQKQILHKLGVVVSVTVIGIACYVLYHMLRGIDVDEVVEAIKGTDTRQIVLAALFVAAGYFTLTFYDWFAVRAIGRSEVPYRVNALAAFTSYSIGHNVGASVFTGGAVRYRIYSAYGLNAIDVAKICFLAGLTFWLGNAAVLGLFQHVMKWLGTLEHKHQDAMQRLWSLRRQLEVLAGEHSRAQAQLAEQGVRLQRLEDAARQRPGSRDAA